MPSPADLPSLLAGRWRVERELRDELGGTAGAFDGEAIFAPAAGGALSWEERGTLRLGGYAGPATRRHAIVPDGSGGWLVEFDDGRPFHPLDLAAGPCAAVHHCGEDVYTGEYALAGPDELRVRWDVVGPRKHQAIRTTYRRLARDAG